MSQGERMRGHAKLAPIVRGIGGLSLFAVGLNTEALPQRVSSGG